MNIFNFLYGLLLVIIFVGVIFYYYNPKRKNDVEAPKYRMLDDDDNDS